jgi:DNA-binding MarR family transcriptional regulator
MKDFECLTSEQRLERSKKIDEFVRNQVMEMTGIDNVHGIQINGAIHRIASLYDAITMQNTDDEGMSGPRMGILFRLYGGEMLNEGAGVTPTMLSHMQKVTKNTISSLVKGLEDQGLIRRENDPVDRRVYRLFLTDAGREYLIKMAPQKITFLNSLLSDLTEEEIEQLSELLTKLQTSLIGHLHFRHGNHDHFPEPPIDFKDK